MIGRKKKDSKPQRSPHIIRQQQSTFHYSSNRSQNERPKGRGEVQMEGPQTTKDYVLNFVTRTPMLIIGFIAALLLAGYISSLTQDPKVVFAPMRDMSIRNAEVYEAATKELAGNGITSYSKILLNRQKITDELQEKFPELEKVSVSTPLLSRRATITITFTEPAVVLVSGTNSYLVDSRGVAILETKDVSDSINVDWFSRIEDQSDTPIQIGKQALTSAQVAFVTEVRMQSEDKKLVINSINLTGGGGELIVKYNDLPYYVRYNLYENARKSFGTFYATKEHLEGAKDPPKEYIDVRIPERAYTK